MDVELGVGVDYIDPEMRLKRRNIRKNIVAQRMKEDTRGRTYACCMWRLPEQRKS